MNHTPIISLCQHASAGVPAEHNDAVIYWSILSERARTAEIAIQSEIERLAGEPIPDFSGPEPGFPKDIAMQLATRASLLPKLDNTRKIGNLRRMLAACEWACSMAVVGSER